MQFNFNPGCAFIYALLNQVCVCQLGKKAKRERGYELLSDATQSIERCMSSENFLSSPASKLHIRNVKNQKQCNVTFTVGSTFKYY